MAGKVLGDWGQVQLLHPPPSNTLTSINSSSTPRTPSFSMFKSFRATTATLRNLNSFSKSNPSKRYFSATSAIMGVTKTLLQDGNGAVPQKGDTVTIKYKGFLKDTAKPDNKGEV